MKLRGVQEVVNKANTQLDDAQDQGRAAGQNVARAEDVINRARESLRQAKNLMDVDGREALRRAQERAKKFGEGNAQMTLLASTARKLAEEQFESASEIESIAKQANELSTEAYKTAYKGLEEQGNTEYQVQELQAAVKEMAAKLAQVQSDSQDTLESASQAYLKALTIYQSVFNLQVPEVETSQMSAQAVRITKDAERIREDAARLLQENDEVARSASQHRAELDQILGQAEAQQQTVDQFMARMEANRDKAEQAVSKGNTVLEKATETLRILNDFENMVNDNRAAAESALDKIANIENTLRLAEEDTMNADEALFETDDKSFKAFIKAVESKETAEEASKNAKAINQESTAVLEKAEKLKEDAADLGSKSAETDTRLKSKDARSQTDAQTAADALREANKAQSSSLEATEKVNQAKNELEEIAQILATIEIQGKFKIKSSTFENEN